MRMPRGKKAAGGAAAGDAHVTKPNSDADNSVAPAEEMSSPLRHRVVEIDKVAAGTSGCGIIVLSSLRRIPRPTVCIQGCNFARRR
jgi:hypothetical protein